MDDKKVIEDFIDWLNGAYEIDHALSDDIETNLAAILVKHGFGDGKSVSRKKRETKPKADSVDAPVRKRKISAYNLFVAWAMKQKDITDLPNTNRMTKIADMWRNLDPESLNDWKSKADAENKNENPLASVADLNLIPADLAEPHPAGGNETEQAPSLV